MTEFVRKVRVRGIIAYGGRFLFVQHKHDQSFWALPGGGLDNGETLEQGLERELIEELGIKPRIGRLLYVQQLFLSPNEESLEFFFLVDNGVDYQTIDINTTTHGALELSRVEFMDLAQAEELRILPEFLTDLPQDIYADNWPKVFVRQLEVR